VRRVFGLASGVYALGIVVRLLRRRSGAASVSPTTPGVARPAPAPPTNRALAVKGDPGREQDDDVRGPHVGAPSGSEPPQEAAGEQASGVVDSAEAETASGPEHVILPARSELDRLPRERLFEIAHATGYRLEHLITMSRDDLVDAVARPVDAHGERPAAPPLRRSHQGGAGPTPDRGPDDPDVNERAG
jgi:hypothetical protein